MPILAKTLSVKEIKSIQRKGLFSIGHVTGLCVRNTTKMKKYGSSCITMGK